MAHLTLVCLALKLTNKCPYKQTSILGNTIHPYSTSSNAKVYGIDGTGAGVKDFLR